MTLRPSTAVWVWCVVLVVAAGYGFTRVKVTSDMAVFLPHDEGMEQTLLLDTLREGPASRLVLVGLRGGNDQAQLAEASRHLAERLRADPQFVRVSNGPASLPATELARWFSYRYLLTDVAPEAFTVAGLQQALAARLQELSAPLPPLDKARLPADPQAVFRRVLSSWEAQQGPALQFGVWFGDGGKMALLLLETRAGSMDLDAQEAARAAILAAVEPGFAAELSGPGVIAAASRDVIRSEVQWLSVLASAAMLLILGLAYRNLRLLLLSSLPLLAAIAAAIAVTSLWFGAIHGITLAFGITLLGVAIDYPLHLFSHLQADEPARSTVRRIWPTLRLGVASTAIGYLAMVTSPFEGLAQLAVFTVAGLIAAALTVRWVLPDLIAPTTVVTVPSLRFASVPHGLWLLPVVAVAAIGYVVLSPRPLLETELAALTPVPEAWRQTDEQLRHAIGAPDVSRLLLIEGSSANEVLRRSEELAAPLQQLRAQGMIEGYQLPSQFLPSMETQLARRAALPDSSELLVRMERARQGLPFRAGVFEPFLNDVEASRAMTPLTPAVLDATLLGERLRAVLRPYQTGWLGLVPLYAVRDEPGLMRGVAEAGLPVRYLNLRRAADETVTRFMRGTGGYLVAGGALILLLLLAGLRRVRCLFQVVFPVMAAVALTIALLHAFGARLSLFHLVALLLVAGLGIDYGLFFARRMEQAEAARTGHAVGVCAISTASVFAILALSQIPVLHAIGATVALGVALSYGFARFIRTT